MSTFETTLSTPEHTFESPERELRFGERAPRSGERDSRGFESDLRSPECNSGPSECKTRSWESKSRSPLSTFVDTDNVVHVRGTWFTFGERDSREREHDAGPGQRGTRGKQRTHTLREHDEPLGATWHRLTATQHTFRERGAGSAERGADSGTSAQGPTAGDEAHTQPLLHGIGERSGRSSLSVSTAHHIGIEGG